MRITIELPQELLEKARLQASASGITLKELLFIAALERRLATTAKVRHEPPALPGPADLHLLTRAELDETMFG